MGFLGAAEAEGGFGGVQIAGLEGGLALRERRLGIDGRGMAGRHLFRRTMIAGDRARMASPQAISTAQPSGLATFLHLTNTHDPRRMQCGLRFYF